MDKLADKQFSPALKLAYRRDFALSLCTSQPPLTKTTGLLIPDVWKLASNKTLLGKQEAFPGPPNLSGVPAYHHNHPDSHHKPGPADPRAAQELLRSDTTRVSNHPRFLQASKLQLPETEQVKNQTLLPSLEPQTFCTRPHQYYIPFQSSFPGGRHLLTHLKGPIPNPGQDDLSSEATCPAWIRAQGQQEG